MQPDVADVIHTLVLTPEVRVGTAAQLSTGLGTPATDTLKPDGFQLQTLAFIEL